MTYATGSRLASYEIVGPLGAGGMGEVYRARDAKLNRDVAVKVLPDLFAADADRFARFEREARALAALNHPGIAQIYGFEDRVLVMELGGGVASARPSGSGAVIPPASASHRPSSALSEGEKARDRTGSKSKNGRSVNHRPR